MFCPACGFKVTATAKFCSRCGGAIGADADETVLGNTGLFESGEETLAPDHQKAGKPNTTPRKPAPFGAGTPGAPRLRTTSQPALSSSSDPIGGGRFAPGSIIAERYRVVALLGKGCMGEVYRAENLRLSQVLAMKFLPAALSQDASALARFHSEVRVARQVSHPNVCRMFDIGDTEGLPFLTMEYVDGEDLSSLLRRIGRLPQDKAIEIARQICAGLAAAHERGVVHRDLKPANMMLDGEGRARITDFGLAGIASTIQGAEVRAGTPAYMSPEQLSGKEVTTRSDIYSLGLVMYELLTGKRAFDAASLPELMKARTEGKITNPSTLVRDLDPLVERVILRCLENDAAKRPASALQVAAALPGGDPLAAALAAGETPSPEMVAAAGKVEGLPRKYSIPCLAVVAVCLFAITWYYGAHYAFMRASLEDSPDVLAHQAREIAASFGYEQRPADSVVWLDHRGPLVDYLKRLKGPQDWNQWLAADAPLQAVYRESRAPLAAEPEGKVDSENPAPTAPGMIEVRVDGHGRLNSFSAAPDDRGPLVPPVDPAVVFRAARLDPAAFHEVPPTLTPKHASDAVRAWKGPHPVIPNTELTLEVAFWKGRVTEAELRYPYMQAAGQGGHAEWAERTKQILSLTVQAIGTLLLALIARRNWKQGRIDRQGAFRVAAARLFLGLVAWAGVVHPATGQDLFSFFQSAFSDLLGTAAFLWLVYLAIEPAVRARYPHAMVTWNRLLAGRWLDAQVWSHVLIGAALGCVIFTWFTIPGAFGSNITWGGNLLYLLGTRSWVGMNADRLASALTIGPLVFAVICGLRSLVRLDLVAALATAVIFTFALEADVYRHTGMDLLITIAIFLSVYTVLAYVLMRLGLIATISLIFFVNSMNGLWLGADWSAWYAPAGLAMLTLLLGIATFAFWRSLGGRELIGGGEETHY